MQAHARRPGYARLINAICASVGVANPIAEFRFHPTRRWRFDFAWPERKIALEIEGGVWNYGRHIRPKGFLADLRKYNTAAIMGWRIIRLTPNMIAAELPNILSEIMGMPE